MCLYMISTHINTKYMYCVWYCPLVRLILGACHSFRDPGIQLAGLRLPVDLLRGMAVVRGMGRGWDGDGCAESAESLWPALRCNSASVRRAAVVVLEAGNL